MLSAFNQLLLAGISSSLSMVLNFLLEGVESALMAQFSHSFKVILLTGVVVYFLLAVVFCSKYKLYFFFVLNTKLAYFYDILGYKINYHKTLFKCLKYIFVYGCAVLVDVICILLLHASHVNHLLLC